MSVLIVDDDPESVTVLERMLRDDGYSAVEVVGTACDAFRRLKAFAAGKAREVELVLLDVGLPDLDGVEACRRIRAVRSLRRVGIVIVTGHGDEEIVERAFQAGANDFVTKPIRHRELRARMRAVIRSLEEDANRASRERALLGVATELQRTTRELERLSQRDVLTGIANRRCFQAEFRTEWRRAARTRGLLSALMFDVDLFHDYNARYGHVQGDRCLQLVARALGEAMQRPSDRLARYGGEEFVALLPDTEGAGACLVAERARVAVEALGLPHAASSCASVVTVSVGVATIAPRPDLSPEILISAADEALYRAKREGRNRCRASDAIDADAFARGSTAPLAIVDPLIVHRVPTFLANRRREVKSIRDALARGAFNAIQAIGHNLRGIGGAFGFAPISELGRRIEEAAKLADAATIRDAVSELAAYLDAVRVVRAASVEADSR